MPTIKNYTRVRPKEEMNLNNKFTMKWYFIIVKKTLFSFFLLGMLMSVANAHCVASDNIALSEGMRLLEQESNSHSSHTLSLSLSNALDMDFFLELSVPTDMLQKASLDDKKQLKIFLKHAVAQSIERYFSDKNLGRFYFQPAICQDKDHQYLLGFRYENGTRPMPFILGFYHTHQWVMNDMAIYTTFLSQAFQFQFKNWALHQTYSQIMVSIRNHNAILDHHKMSAS